jgi:hypothetical protein
MTRRFDPLSTAGPYRALYVGCCLVYVAALVVLGLGDLAWRGAALAAAAAASIGLLGIVVLAFFRETDEFQRRVKGEAMVWASAAVLIALAGLGFGKLALPGLAADRTFLATAAANAIPIWVGLYGLAFQLIGDRFA